MYIKTVSFLLVVMLCSSCQEWQYGVRIANNTGEKITIKYKSTNTSEGPSQQSVDLQKGESKVVLSTKDISNDPPNLKECIRVADHLDVFIHDNIKSKVAWCDDRYSLSVVDIGQKEYFIEFTKDDFDLSSRQ